MSERKQYVINGLLLSNARMFCEYLFGQFYIRAIINRQDNIIEVLLKNKLNVKQENGSYKEETINDYVDTSHFNKHWKGRMRTLIYEEPKQS